VICGLRELGGVCPQRIGLIGLGVGTLAAYGREAPQRFDMLALDAFSSDSIPVHLITREALRVYRRHLAEDNGLNAWLVDDDPEADSALHGPPGSS
jgi:hypothetical protein